MSDFLFSASRRAPGELAGVLQRFLGAVTESVREEHGPWGSLAVAACAHDPDLVHVDDRGLAVLLGWPVLHGAPGLAPAPAFDAPRRAHVFRLLRDGRALAAAGDLSGPFAALVVDPAAGLVTALTDRMGFVPLYRAAAGATLVLGSHVDAVAAAAGRSGAIDPVSAADFVVHSSITFPRTLYEGVVQLDPATLSTWSAGEAAPREQGYWLPVEQHGRFLGRAARELRERFRDAVACGAEGRDRVGLLLSGGEDSRAVLGAMPRGVQVEAFIFGDWENREYRIARQVAALYGARLRFGQRTPAHYLGYEGIGPVLGTQHRYTDVHGWGLQETLALPELPLVFGGYLSDTLLKARYANWPRRKMTCPATPLPGERGGPIIMKAPGLREDLLREVEARRDVHRAVTRRLRPYSGKEWLEFWPFSMRSGGANVHGNRRLFRAYEPFLTNDVLEVAAAVPQCWKWERLLFQRAMRPFLAPSWYVPHGRSKFPYFGPLANLPLGLGVKWTRAVRDRLAGEGGRTQGPWPSLHDLVASREVETRRESLPLAESPILELFRPGLSPEQIAAAQRCWHPEQQLGFLQLVHLVHRMRA